MRETGVCEGGGFSERSSATSIGAACGRLFRLRKTAMLSRHRRLWLSFPSLALPPEERLAFSGVCFCIVGSACECGRSPIGLVESTAADRAAADMRGGERATSRISQKCHDGFTVMAFFDSKRLPPQRKQSCAAAHDGGYSPTPQGRGGSVSRRDHNQAIRNRTPTRRGILYGRKDQLELQPLFGREGSGGRGASLREAASPPRISRSPTVFPGGSAREGAFLKKGTLPRKLTLFQFSA